jgi:hypothetical protein
MRKAALLFVALSLVASRASAAPDWFQKRDWSEAQALTRATPTTDGTIGLDLSSSIAFMVVLDAPTGQTLSGGGEVDLYYYDATLAAWYPGPATGNWTSLSECAGKARCVHGTYDVTMPRGKVIAVTNGVTVSSGTQVTMRILSTTSGQSISY